MNLKQLAAEEAVSYVTSGMKLGLGTGSTIWFVLEALAERLRNGALRNIVGVPTSEATARHAHQLGIAITTLEETPRLDLTIDGADEVDPHLNLIKGLGGALVREKIVAAASEKLIIVVDESKRVARLGLRAPLPVEVLPFGWISSLPLFHRLGAQPQLRTDTEGNRYITDNGNLIVDCAFPEGIDDPHAIAREIDAQPGVLGHGLFLDMTTAVCVGTASGIEHLRAP